MGGPDLYHVFSCGVAEDAELGGLSYFGEDAVFVQRCINHGIEVWADPDIDFSHSGRKTWRGNLLQALLARGERTPEGLKPNLVVVGGTAAEPVDEPNAGAASQPDETGTPHQVPVAGVGDAA